LLVLFSPIFAEEVDCKGSFCQCKQNGHCQIYCDTRSDQCKSSSLLCKAGYPCTVYCLGKSVCVDTRVNGAGATDVTMICDGKDACKASTLSCGSGACALECASQTDCEDTNAIVGSASGWDCIGFCSESKGVPRPATPAPSKRPTMRPTAPTQHPTRSPTHNPTRAPIEPQYLSCTGTAATCECNNAQPCIIQCDTMDSCKDSTLICPRDYDCTVECGDHGCDKAAVTGPTGSNFDINCYGVSSCVDVAVESSMADNVNYVCSGKDSCKGAGTKVNCGSGRCNLQFTGEASGDSATINTNFAIGFKCEGRYAPCPPNYLPPCPGQGAAACTAAQVFNQELCRCECPYLPDAATGCPGAQVFNSKTCQCELNCAAGTPTAAQCASQGLVWRDCACYDSNYCCLTNPVQQEPKQWAGLCWGETQEVSCLAQPNQRCIWAPRNCLENPPRNALDPSKSCGFSTVACAKDSDCCSEFCKPDGLCR